MMGKLIQTAKEYVVDELGCNEHGPPGRWDVFHEHGGPWLKVWNFPEGCRDDEEMTFSIVEAEPGYNGSGLDFEQV